MRRLAGQAARHGGRLLHALAQLALALVVLAAVGIAGAAWRLAQGPVNLKALVPALQAALASDAAPHVTVGRAALAWEGFRAGLGQPLDIRVTDLVLTAATGRRLLDVPRAAVALAPGWLLLGRLVPWAIELDGLRLHLWRAADGAVTLDLPAAMPGGPPGGTTDLPALLRELSARPHGDRSAGTPARWSQLQHLRIADAALRVTDRQLGTDWSVPALAIDLRRPARGGILGRAEATLSVGDLTAHAAAAGTLDAQGQEADLRFRLSPIVPAALARLVKPAAPLAAVDAPLALSGRVLAGTDTGLRRFTLAAQLGAGTLHLGRGTAPVLAAEAVLRGTPQHLSAELIRLVTAPRPGGQPTTVTGHAEVTRSAAGIAAQAALALDRVNFADLPLLWPEGVGGPGTRPWITQNITAGIAHDFHVDVALTAPPDLSDATVTRLAGGGQGTDLTVHWLRPVPPIVHGAARLNFLTPDSLEVVVSAGQQEIGHEAISVHGGRVEFSGLSGSDQFADIQADLAGPITAALTLLDHKRIGLLAKSPLQVKGAAGDFAGRVTVTHLPLRTGLKMDDVDIRATLKLTGARLAGVLAGRDVTDGALDLTADTSGLHFDGQAALAGIAAQVQGDMDFRAGGPAQVLQRLSASGSVSTAQLARLGLNAAPYASGTAQVDAQVTLRRDHGGQATVSADLRGTALTLAALNWRKPQGAPAQAQARIALVRDGIGGVELLDVTGEALRVSGSVSFDGGRPDLIRLDRLMLGTATDLRGTVQAPRASGQAWRVDVFGRSLDASAALKRTPGPPKPQPRPPGPPWRLAARFDQVLLGPGRTLTAVAAHAENDGRIMRSLDVSGRTGATPAGVGAFHIGIVPERGGRLLTGDAADAGALLAALDVMATMRGGRMTLRGRYDDTAPGHPLDGRAEITDFRVRHAPALAKLLQAVTLYGLVDLVQGPGLGFSRLIAPFRFQDDMLELHGARAFSSSLGMTAKGRVDLARQAFDLQGTIVPAYFFNSLLGDLPVVGRLFSPERGGGVFAATYSLRGPMADPTVSVNPLAALTPGFLRGLFGLFDSKQPPR